MTPSPTDTDRLLDTLDAACRREYPPCGLGIHGEPVRRQMLRLVVEQWVAEIQPEVMR